MNFKVFLEIFGSFNYEVPDDKEQQLFDFYMLNNLAGRSAMDNRRMKAYSTSGQDIGTRMSSMDGAGDMSEDDKINYMLDEAKQKLLPVLKNNLLDAVFFSISAEFRHIFNYNPTKTILDRLREPEELEAFKKYARNLSLFQDKRVSDDLVRLPNVNKDMVGQNAERNSSFYAASKVHDRATFVRMCGRLFNEAQWSSMFGGPAWAGITQAWLGLDKAQKSSELFVQIDHVYDIQHNNGTVLNKVDNYAKNGNYSWLSRALNFKADIKDPFEIIEHVSPRMKKFAIRAIKNKTGKSWEQFEKEKSSSDEGQYVQAVKAAGDGYDAVVGITLTKILEKLPDPGSVSSPHLRDIIDSYMKSLEKIGVVNSESKGALIREVLKHAANFNIFKEVFNEYDIHMIRAANSVARTTLLNKIHSQQFYDVIGQHAKNYSALDGGYADKVTLFEKNLHFPEEYAKYSVFYCTLVEKNQKEQQALYGQEKQSNPNDPSNVVKTNIDRIFKSNPFFVDAAASALLYLNNNSNDKIDLKMNKLINLFNKTPNDNLIQKQLEISYKQIVGRYNQHEHNFNLMRTWFGSIPSPAILKVPLENLQNIYNNLVNSGLHIPTNPNLDSYEYTNNDPIKVMANLHSHTGYPMEYTKYLSMYFTLRARMIAMKADAQKNPQNAHA